MNLGSLLKEGRWNYCPRCDTQTMTRTSDNQWDCAMCGLTMIWVEPPSFMIWSDALTLDEIQRENKAISVMMEPVPVPVPMPEPEPEPQIPSWRVRWSFRLGEIVMRPLGYKPLEIRGIKQKKEADSEHRAVNPEL